MKINPSGLAIVKHFEGFRAVAYLCPAGVPTIGYGSTGPDIKLGMAWTKDQAEKRLMEDMDKFERAVTDLAKVVLTWDQFSALVSFAYNVGAGALAKSTLLKKLNEGRRAESSDEFLKWNRGGGRVLPGLTRRRQAERSLYLSEDWEQWLA